MNIVAPACRLALSLGLTAGLVALAAPAQAAVPASDRMQQTVSIADLDLSSAAGQAVAARRLRAAADAVCQENSAGATQRCSDRALAAARQLVAARLVRPVALAAR